MRMIIAASTLLMSVYCHGTTTYDKVMAKVCKSEKFNHCSLIKAIAHVESNINPHYFNPEQTGSYGMMQVQCKTARFLGMKSHCSNLFNPAINIRYAIKYITYLRKRYTELRHIVSAYNAGHALICQIPQRCYPEGVSNYIYVNKVLALAE